MKIHPFADSFPLMTALEFEELVADIRANGLAEPIITYEAMILDGRNRYRACEIIGIQPTFAPYKGNDPAGYVWSRNAVRRNLTPAQRAIAATKLATAKHGGDRRSNQVAGRPLDGLEAVAEKAGVGKRSIIRARAIINNAVPEVVEAVRDGHLALSPAERVSELTQDEQKKIMKTVPVEDIPAQFPDPRDRGPEKREGHKTLTDVQRVGRLANKLAADAPIKLAANGMPTIPPPLGNARGVQARRLRTAWLAALAKRGTAVDEIASELSISKIAVRRLAKLAGIEIMADRVQYRTQIKAPDPVRVMTVIVGDLDALVWSLDHAVTSTLSPEQSAEWSAKLFVYARALNQVARRMIKEQS